MQPSYLLATLAALWNMGPTIFPTLALIWLALSTGYLTHLWMQHGRERAFTVAAPEYSSPEKLRPLELATVLGIPPYSEIGGRVTGSARPFVSTIVDLAQRGFLSIERDPACEYYLQQLTKDETGLVPFEQIVLRELFKSGQRVSVARQRAAHASTYWSMQTAVHNDLLEAGVFDARSETIALKATAWILVSIAGASLSGLFGSFMGMALFMASIATTLLFSGIIKRRSAVGVEYFKKAKGYGAYLTATMKERAEFYEREEISEKELPFAILFGLGNRYADMLSQLIKQVEGQSIYPKSAMVAGQAETYDGIYPTAMSTRYIAERLAKAQNANPLA